VAVAMNETLDKIQQDIKDLKDAVSKMAKILSHFEAIQKEIEYNKTFADEARKVIHKRIDRLESEVIKSKDLTLKIIIGVSSVAITTLLGILLGVVKL
jgi:DNA repair exonuclease SbcCD ATPase subunit